jgi:hypothetical protein
MCVVQDQRISYVTSRYVNEGSSVQRKCALPSSLSVLCTSIHQTLHAVVLKRQYLFRNAAGICSKQSRKWRCLDTLSGESRCPALASALRGRICRSKSDSQLYPPLSKEPHQKLWDLVIMQAGPSLFIHLLGDVSRSGFRNFAD